jgi:MFS family permease
MKKDISILIGNALDRFDTSLYGFLAPIMGPIFFPGHDPVMQLILTYATSITSLFSRPIGTFLFGMIARSKGPIFGLSYSLIGVAITTVCIGCIPSYAAIGTLAPLSLIIIRIIRGVFAAGESVIAKLYIMENKSDHQALTASHLYQSSSMLGIIMASAVSTIVINCGGHNTWRLCFVAGGITGFVGYFLRYYAFESREIKQSNVFGAYKVSSLWLLWSNRGNIIRVAVATCFSHITYAVPFVFMNNFVPLITTISLSTMMVLNTGLLVFDMICIPVIGRFTMHYSMYKVMISAASILTITVVPLFVFLPHASLTYVTGMRIWIVFWGLVFLCPLNFWFNSLFNAADKYFLVGMGNALGVATLGHMTTPICLWLWYISGISYVPAFYIMMIMSATIWVVKTSKKQ